MEPVNLILTAPAILAIVQFAKGFGLKGNWSALVAIVVAVAIYVADYYFGATGVYAAVVQGLLLGLAAAGLYDFAKVTRTPPTE